MPAEFLFYGCFVVLSGSAIAVSADPADLWIITYAAVFVFVAMAAVSVFNLRVYISVKAGPSGESDLKAWVTTLAAAMILSKLYLEPAYLWISSWTILMVGLYTLRKIIKLDSAAHCMGTAID
jgi:hypothetical protein